MANSSPKIMNEYRDTNSKSAIARIEEAGTGTHASKGQIGNVASAKTTAGTRVPAKWLRN